MSLQAIGRRYAAALADVTIERREAREVQQELGAWESMMDQSPQLREVFGNPTVSYDQKRGVLNELIARTKAGPTTANFLQVLLKNQRLTETELSEINRRLAQVLDERAGVVAAEVTTARPISDEMRRAIQQRLRSVTGKEIRLNFETDDNIIGGLVTRIGSIVYDGSIRTQLELLANRLARG